MAKFIPFGTWTPDLFTPNDQRLANDVNGVIPAPNCYMPWPDLAAFSADVGAAVIGGIMARDANDNYVVFVGTSTGLYKYVSASSWDDVTRTSGGAYSVPSGEYWSMDQFGDYVIAVNGTDAPQYFDLTGSTDFAALAGSPPTARYVRTVGDFLFLAGLASNPRRVQWSARNDCEFWTSGQRDSDFQDFADGGEVTGITPLEVGLIFQASGVRKFVPTNDRKIFNFVKIEDARGCVAPNSITTNGNMAYYYSDDGFRAMAPDGQSIAIGEHKINTWFYDNSNRSRLYAIIGAADPVSERVFWAFPGDGVSSAYLDYLLCYDIPQGRTGTHTDDRWTYTDQSATSYLMRGSTLGYTMEDLDAISASLDALGISLDSRIWKGGAPLLVGFGSDNKLSFYTGNNMAATVVTADFQPIPGRRAELNHGVRLLTDAANAQVAIGTREHYTDTVSYNTATSMNASGFAPSRANGLLFRAKVTIAAAETWTHLQGIEVPDEVGESGER